jgi:hypothetical protein
MIKIKMSNSISEIISSNSSISREDMILFKGKFYNIEDLDTIGPTEKMLREENI